MGAPEHATPLVNTGVTVMVAVSTVEPGLAAINEAMLPVPLAASPIAGVLFVQLNTVPGTVPVKLTAVVAVSLHNSWLPTAATFGVGFTVMVNVVEAPVQVVAPFVNEGVTVMVPLMGARPVLVAVNEAMLPVPLAARPIAVLEFVQVKVVPAVGLPNVTAVVAVPAQIVWLATALTVGLGFTVMVKVVEAPVQVTPAFVKEGVTVMVATTGAVPAFRVVNEAMLPVPLAARPIAGVLFVQLNTVPVAAPEKVTAAVVVPAQRTWLATALTVGVGFTVMVNVRVPSGQVTPLFVNVADTVIVATTGAAPVFTAVKEAMSPVPLAPRPIKGVLFVQVNTVPGTVPVKPTAAVALPLQAVWLAGWSIVGVGFTVTMNCIGVPVQVAPLAVNEAVTVNVALSGAVPTLVAVKPGMLPVPLVAARPMASAVRVQLNVTGPVVWLEKTTEGTILPGQ